MDRWTRNERRYRYLRDMGLFVVPIYSDGEYPGIEYMQVASSMREISLLPTTPKKPAKKLGRRLVALSSVVQPK